MKIRSMSLLLTIATMMIFLLACDSSANKAEADKSNSGELTIQEAETLIKGLLKDNADVEYEIIKIQQSQMAGLWEVRANLQGDNIILYTDDAGKKVLLPPQGIQVYMIEVESGKVYTAETLSEMSKIDPATMPLENAIILGAKEAKNRVVVYDDPF